MRWPLLVAVAIVTSVLGAPAAAVAAPQRECRLQIDAQKLRAATVGPSLGYDLSRLPPEIDGRGIRVAVLDSGVDPGHEKLQGKIVGQQREFFRKPTDPKDCVSHGTGVASLIVGNPSNPGFRGLAPGARILSARVSERSFDNKDADQASPAEMAEAVRWAVQNGARVINFSFAYISDVPELAPLKKAIADVIATEKVIVVAAAGNKKGEGNPTSYPANWPGVIGVGALGTDGMRLNQSQTGDYVDIVAPGQNVLTAFPYRNFYVHQSGTSFATPLVSATIALIWQRYPTLTAAQVQQRLFATADPAPGGRRSDGYGVGLLNPVRAVNEVLDTDRPAPALAVAAHKVTDEEKARAARAESAWDKAVLISGIGVVVAAIAVALMIGLPAGIRRGWRRP